MTTIPLDRTTQDARNRAWRTFLQGLLVDVAVAVVFAVGPSVAGSDFAFTRVYWLGLGVLAARTAVQAAVSYVARRKLPPPPELLPALPKPLP